jgi:primosomal protein N' (replication factor Y)
VTEPATKATGRAAVGRRPASTPRRREPASALPVARVAIDSPLPHLDRPFDYLVPAELHELIHRGSRVRVRFAGRLTDAWVLQRTEVSDHDGRLAYLERGVGNEPILTPETAVLFRAVADRWAGTFADVLRLGVPPRHARAESAASPQRCEPVTEPQADAWARYRAGPAFLAAAHAGRAARAVWNAAPGEDWPARIAELVQSCLAGGRGAIVVVPDARDTARVDAALSALLPANAHITLSADLGPEARYRRWLAVRRGNIPAVLGTRSAVFAPVADLGLIVIWDDGDDLHAEPRAPYPHARDVAVLRAAQVNACLVVGGFAQTAESALLLQSGWAQPIAANRDVVRLAAPRIVALGDDVELERDPAARSARLPALAFRAAREALNRGKPVLAQVPRRGYVPSLACVNDRTPVRCVHCHGPVAAMASGATPACRWCGRTAAQWRCPRCQGSRMRAVVIGAGRTAEEIGRAFPGTVTRSSAGDQVLDEIPPGPSVVIATPGAEPVVSGGYGAALLLDGWALLSRADLRAAEETLRRWCNAVALVSSDGTVVVGADAALAPVQALVRWDPAGHAERELADRQELGFPPIARMASISGAPGDIADLLSLAHLPTSAEELGSVPISSSRGPGPSDQIRTLLRVPRPDGIALAEALHAAAAIRSAKKSGAAVRIALDPLELF